jgi:hypothetical protein
LFLLNVATDQYLDVGIGTDKIGDKIIDDKLASVRTKAGTALSTQFAFVNTGDSDGSMFVINTGTGLPLHVDGNGDKLASVRWGNVRDAFSKFRIVNTGDSDGSKFLINVGTGLPLHIDGGCTWRGYGWRMHLKCGDKLASVRWGNVRDAFSKFKIRTTSDWICKRNPHPVFCPNGKIPDDSWVV